MMKTLSDDSSISLDFVVDMHAHSTSMNAFCFVNLDEDLGKMQRSPYSSSPRPSTPKPIPYPQSKTPYPASYAQSTKTHTLETHAPLLFEALGGKLLDNPESLKPKTLTLNNQVPSLSEAVGRKLQDVQPGEFKDMLRPIKGGHRQAVSARDP